MRLKAACSVIQGQPTWKDPPRPPRDSESTHLYLRAVGFKDVAWPGVESLKRGRGVVRSLDQLCEREHYGTNMSPRKCRLAPCVLLMLMIIVCITDNIY
jgi:hypothetical protein